LRRFEDKVVLITGGASGLGLESARQFAGEGARLVLVDWDRAGVESAGKSLGASVLSGDVSEEGTAAAAVGLARSEFGRLDVLFNNAGITTRGAPLEELTVEEWKSVVDVNLTGAFLCTQQAFLLMKSQQPQGGRIINNGSISAHVPRPNSAPYTATKHAITGLTRSTSLDGRRFNIACGQIDIGNAATDMTAAFASGVLQANGQIAAEPRLDVAHVVRAVLYMASLPLDANVQFMTVMATAMPFIGRG
jgi:NAD(P)-dependent dehydrogenase (short-subunit alcohol dehydrogenase family)